MPRGRVIVVGRSRVYYWQSFGDCAGDRRSVEPIRESAIAAATRICHKCVVRVESRSALKRRSWILDLIRFDGQASSVDHAA